MSFQLMVTKKFLLPINILGCLLGFSSPIFAGFEGCGGGAFQIINYINWDFTLSGLYGNMDTITTTALANTTTHIATMASGCSVNDCSIQVDTISGGPIQSEPICIYSNVSMTLRPGIGQSCNITSYSVGSVTSTQSNVQCYYNFCMHHGEYAYPTFQICPDKPCTC